MRNLVKEFKALSFENRTTLMAKISMIFNYIVGTGKIVLSLFYSVFFLTAGIMNFLVGTAKYLCYRGIKNENMDFNKTNKLVVGLIVAAGLQYTIYMLRLVLWGEMSRPYGFGISILIASVSFVEIGIAIYGLFKAAFKGHYFRNLKLINFCTSMTAIVLTMLALLSANSKENNDMLCGLVGSGVGLVIILLAFYMLIAPKYSIIDREYNEYELMECRISQFKEKNVEIVLADSFWFGGYKYVGNQKDDKIKGHIIRTKNKFKTLNIFVKILLIILSEILIFVYAVGYVIFLIKNIDIIYKLDEIMLDHGFNKVETTMN